MAQLDIYHYESPRQFLLDSLAEKQKSDPQFSIRAFARAMGLSSHTLLLMLIQGKRPLRVKHAGFLAKGLSLTSEERLYLQALIQMESAQNPEEKNLCKLWMSDLCPPARKGPTQEVNDLKIVSHWIHFAILTLTETEDFQGGEQEISDRFRGKVTIHEVRSALERLQSSGLLKRDEEGRLRATYQKITSADDVINYGVREHHKKVSDLAKKAIDEQAMDDREFQAFSVAMNKNKLPLAKEMIRKFRQQLTLAMKSDDADEVYQINLQLFQLTESPSRVLREEDEGVDTDFLKKKERVI